MRRISSYYYINKIATLAVWRWWCDVRNGGVRGAAAAPHASRYVAFVQAYVLLYNINKIII